MVRCWHFVFSEGLIEVDKIINFNEEPNQIKGTSSSFVEHNQLCYFTFSSKKIKSIVLFSKINATFLMALFVRKDNFFFFFFCQSVLFSILVNVVCQTIWKFQHTNTKKNLKYKN